MESKLRKTLIDTGVAVSAYSGLSNQPDLFEFVIRLAEKQTPRRAVNILDREIRRLARKPISKANFKRALNQELLDLYSGIASNSRLANFLGEYLMVSGSYMRGFEILNAYKKLTPRDLQRVAKKYFQKNKRTMVQVVPAKNRKGKGKRT